MLEYTSYTVQWGRDNKSLEHDWLSADDMNAMVQLRRVLLKPREHGNLFCRVLELGKLYRALSKETEEKEIVNTTGSRVRR